MNRALGMLLIVLVVAGYGRLAVAQTITWTGAEDGEWTNSLNWDLGRKPADGDTLVFPAVASNKTQTAPYINAIAIELEGGGYVIGPPSKGLTLDVGGISSVGTNTINCQILQSSRDYTSNDGTLIFGGLNSLKNLYLYGNGDFLFNGNVTAGTRLCDFHSTGVARFQTALPNFAFGNLGNAYGIRIFSSGTMLVNCTQVDGTLVYGVGGEGTLGGNGTIQAATNAAYAGSGVVALGAQANALQPTGNGILSPGDPEVNDGIGTFTVTAEDRVIFGSDSNSTTGTLAIQIGDAGAGDILAINGDLELSATNSVLSLTTALGVAPDGEYPFLTFTGNRTGTFASVLLNGVDVTVDAESGFLVAPSKSYLLFYEGTSNGLIKLGVAPDPFGTVVTIR